MARVLISSTSLDLVDHRARLMDTLRRMEQDGIGMEFFGAQPETPVQVCESEVDRADLVVLIVAHRYGWVPSVAQGGDGISSITRLEYLRATRPPTGTQSKPVLAFLVDPESKWTSGREQDALLKAGGPEEALQVYRAVKSLQSFKDELGKSVCDKFSEPSDLAEKAGAAVAKWLLKRQHKQQTNELAQRALQELMDKVASHLRNGAVDVALVYLDNAQKTADANNAAPIAEKRLELTSAHLSLLDDRLISAAKDVIAMGGGQQASAKLWLAKCESLQSRVLWKQNKRQEAWALASLARSHFEGSIELDGLDPDAFGSLGGLLKRMAEWAEMLFPDQTRTLEDEMLRAYERGWRVVPHTYPLLNYLEQRASLAAIRSEFAHPITLVRKDEAELREALEKALKTRITQLGNRQDRPWAAFDVARARHYLTPNVPGFLEDLDRAVEDARSVATRSDDRYMITTTRDSLLSLKKARIRLEGLDEGIEILNVAAANDDWYLGRPQRPAQYLEQELLKLRADLTETLEHSGWQAAASAARVEQFIHDSEVRWSRTDEQQFQDEIAKWKRDLEPTELKVLRGLWKIFGAKALDTVTGGIPLDWQAAASIASKVASR